MTTQHHLDGAEFLTEKTKGLYEPDAPASLGINADRSSKSNRAVTDSVPYFQDWREAAHRVKQYAIANLDKLLAEFERNISARGAIVLWAKDAAEANEHVLRIAREHNVKSVVKSKSMVTEEMELNRVLEEEGIRAVETDLGEYIVQLAGQRPVHIVTPAIHMSAADVGHLFTEKLGEPYSEEHNALTDIARRHLREEYLQADMGVSGCNFAIADTGTAVVIENEGNAGLSTATPPVHVAVVGIEKVLPRLEDLPLFLNLLPRSGTGQKLTSYTHLIHGPVPGRKLYVIIIDNGRSKVLLDPAARAALYCIRCGACINNCPVYRHAGGWA
ncbi:MAG: lactate utilization protein, partial [Pirellulaceae bacterium]|nr:lactate utilization protein [Pirellulaceae bacterium]